MGKYDLCMWEYLQNRERFADLFNGSCFQGRPVIRAEDLEEASERYTIDITSVQDFTMDDLFLIVELNDDLISEILISVNSSCGNISDMKLVNKKKSISKEFRIRDIKMHLKSGITLKVLAIENQSYIDYGMPIRCMEYDESEPELRELFKDYPLTLFCINEHADFKEFHSELKEFFQALSYRKDKKKLEKLTKDDSYAHLSEATWDAIATMTDAPSLLEKKQKYRNQETETGGYNMCQAMKELLEDQWNEGVISGEENGIRKEKEATVIRMLIEGLEMNQICKLANCERSLVEEIQKKVQEK